MRVLHINTKYKGGGAARAMQRLHAQLVEKGHQSRFLVGRSDHQEHPLAHVVSDVVEDCKKPWDGLLSRIGNQMEDLGGIHPWAYRPTLRIPDTELYHWAEIIDLRNLFGDYINFWVLPELTAGKPVVWRLPDLWALTGHCAYPYDCLRWISGCYDCPLLQGQGREIVEPPPTKWDGTRRVWRAKRDIYARSRFHIVVTTQWMKSNVERSILSDALSINVISNGVDLQVYRPRPKKQVRQELGLPEGRMIGLFAAADLKNYRKGYRFAADAVANLQGDPDSPLLVTMGRLQDMEQDKETGFRHFGFVGDPEQQAKLYAAADFFLCSTLADAQPQTALESIACGTPIIGFDVGPMADLAGHGKYGLIADEIQVESLQEVIQYACAQPGLLQNMAESCREQALQEYDLDKQTNQYIALYRDILAD